MIEGLGTREDGVLRSGPLSGRRWGDKKTERERPVKGGKPGRCALGAKGDRASDKTRRGHS